MEILTELGYTDAEIKGMKDNKIILITLFYVSLMNMFFDSYFFAIQTTAIFSLLFSLFWNGDKLE